MHLLKSIGLLEINKHSRVHLDFISSPTCLRLKGFVAADAVHYYTIQVRFCDKCAVTKKLMTFVAGSFQKLFRVQQNI